MPLPPQRTMFGRARKRPILRVGGQHEMTRATSEADRGSNRAEREEWFRAVARRAVSASISGGGRANVLGHALQLQISAHNSR